MSKNGASGGSAVKVVVAILLAVIALFLLIFTATRLFSFSPDRPEEDPNASGKWRPALEEDTITYEGVTYKRKSRVESYLILGVDKTEEQRKTGQAGQADVLLLLVLDAEQQAYRILNINRDTVTQITVLSPDGSISSEKFEPICLSHAYGTGGPESCENTVRSVEYLLAGIKPDGYIALDLTAIGVLNDAVGGVTVTVDKDLTAMHPALKKGATVKLDAASAEAYVRARMYVGEEDNLSRMNRQVGYMTAWFRQAQALGEQRLIGLLDSIEEVCVTDLTEKRLAAVADIAMKYENLGFCALDGEYVRTVSFNEFHADDDSVTQMILELFYTAE